MKQVHVELLERSYEVVIGEGASDLLSSLVAEKLPAAKRCVVISEPGVAGQQWFGRIDPGIEFSVELVPSGEGAKRLGEVERLCERFSALHLSRNDLLVAVGGGVVSDLVGFAASVYLRGIAYVSVATTLLSQIDAAIGGKTGVNLDAGKNLVGTFWQPRGVLCDLNHLGTLPEREWACGRGEMAKYAFLGVENLGTLTLGAQVQSCVALKAAVVGADEREGDRRMILNYGHTLAHALESAAFGTDELRHGEAVAVGLHFAAILARDLGRISQERVDEHRALLAQLGLADTLSKWPSPTFLLSAMARDKKATHNLTFVLDGKNGVEEVKDVDPDVVRRALAELFQCS
jgi:5-deoxy-5-amino-3-dehydroquinate synthase